MVKMLRNKVNDLGNEKKMLITRLMQISFLVDDHVYNDKRIPATDAQAYIAELSSYNIRKYNDIRISQVTEKLLRCMKRIIIEEQEGIGHATHVSESIDKVSNTNNIIINLPSHSELNIQSNVTTLVENGTTLVENRNENINNVSAKAPIENNLDSDPNEKVAEHVIDDIPIDKYQYVVHNIPITTEHEVVTYTTNEFKNKPGNKVNEVVETESKNDLISEGLCEKNNKDIKNKLNLKTEIKKRSYRRKVEKKVEQKAKVSKPPIQKNKCTRKTKKDKLKNTITSIEPKLSQERTELDKNSIDHLVTNTETLKNTRRMIIYKKSTVDDLSWIEDIRYVREKDNEEFDEKSNILEDVFWNDCTLPPNLSEEDFILS